MPHATNVLEFPRAPRPSRDADHLRPDTTQLHLRIARMMGYDYVFLTDNHHPERQLPDSELAAAAYQVVDDLGLDPDHTVIMHLIRREGEDSFRRCDITWVDEFPITLTSRKITAAGQLDFTRTVFDHADDLYLALHP